MAYNDDMINAVKGGPKKPQRIPTLREPTQQDPMTYLRNQITMAKLLKESTPHSEYARGFDTSDMGHQSQALDLVSKLKDAYLPSSTTSDASHSTSGGYPGSYPAGTGGGAATVPSATGEAPAVSGAYGANLPPLNLPSLPSINYGQETPVQPPQQQAALAPTAVPRGQPRGLTDINHPSVAATFAQIESTNNPNAPPNKGKNRGLYQFGPREEAKYGLNESNWNDVNAQNAALQMAFKDYTTALRNAGITEHTPARVYLTHQQGPAGGPALINADPNALAWQVIRRYYGSDEVAKSAITGNLISDMPAYGKGENITAGEFVRDWTDKFNRMHAAAGRQYGITPPGAPTSPSAMQQQQQPPDTSSGSLF